MSCALHPQRCGLAQRGTRAAVGWPGGGGKRMRVTALSAWRGSPELGCRTLHHPLAQPEAACLSPHQSHLPKHLWVPCYLPLSPILIKAGRRGPGGTPSGPRDRAAAKDPSPGSPALREDTADHPAASPHPATRLTWARRFPQPCSPASPFLPAASRLRFPSLAPPHGSRAPRPPSR